MLNFDIVWLVMDELLDLPFDDVGLHEGSESSHDAWLETDATAPESIIIGSQHHGIPFIPEGHTVTNKTSLTR